jgi:hypothetical protein
MAASAVALLAALLIPAYAAAPSRAPVTSVPARSTPKPARGSEIRLLSIDRLVIPVVTSITPVHPSDVRRAAASDVMTLTLVRRYERRGQQLVEMLSDRASISSAADYP